MFTFLCVHIALKTNTVSPLHAFNQFYFTINQKFQNLYIIRRAKYQEEKLGLSPMHLTKREQEIKLLLV